LAITKRPWLKGREWVGNDRSEAGVKKVQDYSTWLLDEKTGWDWRQKAGNELVGRARQGNLALKRKVRGRKSALGVSTPTQKSQNIGVSKLDLNWRETFRIGRDQWRKGFASSYEGQKAGSMNLSVQGKGGAAGNDTTGNRWTTGTQISR